MTFDLRFCRRCGAGGIVLFVFICKLTLQICSQYSETTDNVDTECLSTYAAGLVTVFLALLILFFDFPLPDELKGFIFFAQVIGVIYRNAPYLLGKTGPGVSQLLLRIYSCVFRA